MALLPVMLDLTRRRVVVVGGGAVAFRKVKALLACKARPIVVAPRLGSDLSDLCRQGRVRWFARAFEPRDVTGARLVIAATDDGSVNDSVVRETRRRGGMAVATHRARGGGCAFAAALRRGALTVGVSTGGRLPALSAYLKRRLEAVFPPVWSRVLVELTPLRKRLARSIPDESTRRTAWQAILEGPALDNLLAGDDRAFRDEVETCISSFSE